MSSGLVDRCKKEILKSQLAAEFSVQNDYIADFWEFVDGWGVSRGHGILHICTIWVNVYKYIYIYMHTYMYIYAIYKCIYIHVYI